MWEANENNARVLRNNNTKKREFRSNFNNTTVSVERVSSVINEHHCPRLRQRRRMCAYTHSPDCQLTSCGRRELFSELSNSTEPRITHSNTSNVLQCALARSAERIKDSGIPRGRIRNIDPRPRSAERSSIDRSIDPVDSRLTASNAE